MVFNNIINTIDLIGLSPVEADFPYVTFPGFGNVRRNRIDGSSDHFWEYDRPWNMRSGVYVQVAKQSHRIDKVETVLTHDKEYCGRIDITIHGTFRELRPNRRLVGWSNTSRHEQYYIDDYVVRTARWSFHVSYYCKEGLIVPWSMDFDSRNFKYPTFPRHTRSFNPIKKPFPGGSASIGVSHNNQDAMDFNFRDTLVASQENRHDIVGRKGQLLITWHTKRWSSIGGNISVGQFSRSATRAVGGSSQIKMQRFVEFDVDCSSFMQ